MINKFLYLLFLLFLSINKISNVNANTLLEDPLKFSTFNIVNFPSSIHGGQNATWGITQADDGRLYFANSYGVLIYDGIKWRNLETRNSRPARSILKDKSGQILVGTKGDVGLLSSDRRGESVFKSLLESSGRTDLPQGNADTVYEIIDIGSEEYIYRTSKNIYHFKNNKIQKYKNPNNFKFGVMRLVDNKLFVYVRGKGLYEYIDNSFKIVNGTETFIKKKQTIYGTFKYKQGLLLITRGSGLFYLDKGNIKKIPFKSELINNTTIYRAIKMKNGSFALATYDGILILDKDLKLKNHLSKSNGLMENNVRSLFEDRDGNLWAGLSSGISLIKLNLDLKFYNRNLTNINSTISDFTIFNNNIFLATETGVKISKPNNDLLRQSFLDFKSSPKTQIWDLLTDKNEMYIGSNNGLGRIDFLDNYYPVIDKKITGSIYKIQNSKIFKDSILLGSRKGLFIFNKKNSSLKKLSEKIKGSVWRFYESAENSEVWFIIYGKGIYSTKVENVDGSITFKSVKINPKVKLPSSHLSKIYIHEINKNIYIFYKGKVLKYSRNKTSFEEQNEFADFIKHKTDYIFHIKKISPNNYWFAKESRSSGSRKISYFSVDENYKIKRLPLDDLSDLSRIKINTYDNKIIITGNEGVAITSKTLINPPSSGKAIITDVKVNKNKFYAGALTENFLSDFVKINVHSYENNNIRFNIALTDFYNSKMNKFRYKLDGFDDWSEFTNNTQVTYTNLAPGKYNLIVEGLNGAGIKLKPTNYDFKINPPWWQTTYFYICEILFFIVLILITAFSKSSSKGQKFATAMTFVVIIIFFEFLNMFIDPLLIKITGGVPVFDLLSKVILGLLLQPIERLASKLLDLFTDYVSKRNIIKIS